MKVKYVGATDNQVRWGSNDDPRGLLIKGQIYNVSRKEEHSWHTKLYLEKFPKLKFNSVCFKEVEG